MHFFPTTLDDVVFWYLSSVATATDQNKKIRTKANASIQKNNYPQTSLSDEKIFKHFFSISSHFTISKAATFLGLVRAEIYTSINFCFFTYHWNSFWLLHFTQIQVMPSRIVRMIKIVFFFSVNPTQRMWWQIKKERLKAFSHVMRKRYANSIQFAGAKEDDVKARRDSGTCKLSKIRFVLPQIFNVNKLTYRLNYICYSNVNAA